MRSDISSALSGALSASAIAPRDFLWITARDRDTAEPVTWGAWSDVGTISAEVADAETGLTVSRVFEGAGSLISVGQVQMVSGLEVQAVSVVISQITPHAEQLIRGYDARRAKVELYRGFLDTQTMRLVGPALPVFSGFLDEAPIVTPKENEEGSITLVCASHAQELTRSSTAKRSDADQRLRNAEDAFFQDAATVGTWQVFWGQDKT
jgi:hypothetical protein